jgi:hypothetical protein
MAEHLILPVAETLTATYLVPAKLDDTTASERTLSALAAHIPDPVGTVARKMLEVGAVHVSTQQASALPPLPAELQEHLGVAPHLIRAVTEASTFVVVSAAWPPGWPPVHESVARASSAALAADLEVPLVDAFVPKVLAPVRAIETLPSADSQLKVSDWVLVFQSAGPLGLWMTTKGLGRFGLPELQLRNVPQQLGGPWIAILSGIAAHLLDLWLDALRERDGSAFAQIPEEFEVSKADVANAYGGDSQDGGRARLRLTLDPASDDHGDSFLTVQPPDDYRASVGEYFADVSAQLFGHTGGEVRYLPRTEAMKQAMQDARDTLPAIRSRFLAGDLPLKARLMVKHAITTPAGTEYLWTYVNSWNDPARVLGNSSSDGMYNPQVRAGRPIVIEADVIVDWAIWIDGQGVVEGGLTNAVALNRGTLEKP